MLLVALSIVPCVVMLFYQRPMLLLYMWPVMILISSFFVDSTLGVEGLARSNIWLVPMDVVYFFTIVHLGLWASLHPKKVVWVLKENPFLSVFIALVVLYIIIETPIWGKTAIGAARKLYFMFLIPWLAAVVIKNPADLRRFLVVIVWVAVGYAITAVGTAVVTGNLIRTFSAHAALYLALAAFSMLVHRIYRIVLVGPILDRVLLWLFFGTAITAGHRTVWLALGCGLLLALWLYGTKQARIAKVSLAIIIMIAGLGVGIALFPETGARLGVAFEGILNPQADATASWRIEGWQQQLDRLRQGGNLLFGEGFGSSYWRYGLLSSHNAYIEMILKLGLFGLALYSLLVFKFIRNALAVRKTLATGPMRAWLEVGILTFGAAHAYSTGYSFEPIMLVFLAVGNSACRLSQHRSVEFRAARGQHAPAYRNFVLPIQRHVRARTNVVSQPPTSKFEIYKLRINSLANFPVPFGYVSKHTACQLCQLAYRIYCCVPCKQHV